MSNISTQIAPIFTNQFVKIGAICVEC